MKPLLMRVLTAGAVAAAWAAVLAAWPTTASAQATRPRVDLRCQAVAIGPTLDCVVTLATRDGVPLSAAEVRLGATMPSMPMAHAVKPVRAQPTGRLGEYRGTLELEMSGLWAVQVDIAGPLRDRIVRRLQAEECTGDAKRCAVLPAAGRP